MAVPANFNKKGKSLPWLIFSGGGFGGGSAN
jgi:hypothetical protein